MLTQEQIDTFHRDGFLIIRGMFQGQELEKLRAAADAVEAEGQAEKGEDHLYQTIDGKKTYFRSERMWDRGDIFQAVTVKPELLECIGQCAGHPFLPINDSFVCKIPEGNVPIPWHQDPPYGSPKTVDTYEIPNFDTDIYLDHSTIENGCVWGIPGHHLVGHVDLQKYSQDELFEKFGAEPMIMEPGDVLFHTLSGPHGSVGNKTKTKRRIFYVHYMAKGVLENSYPGWGLEKRGGFTQQGLDFVQGMLDARQRLGYEGLDGSQIEFTNEGFEFTGSPNTPPYHWRTLIDQMSAEEIERKRRLEPVVPA